MNNIKRKKQIQKNSNFLMTTKLKKYNINLRTKSSKMMMTSKYFNEIYIQSIKIHKSFYAF